jgi:galactose mutarotase-like enzyme
MFSLVEANPANALFRLDWDEETFRLYPFRFRLDLKFALIDATLDIVATVKNLDNKNLPASFGFHPAFRWPLPYGEARADHFLEFEKAEPAPVRRLDSRGLVMEAGFETPIEDRKLHLRDGLFTADAIIFDAVASRRIVYGAKRGPKLTVEYPGMPYLGVWTKPGAEFICIEPWHGLADPQAPYGDFYAKPGLVLLAPGASHDFSMSIAWTD